MSNNTFRLSTGRQGFTLAEVLLVMTIIIILLIIVALNIKGQVGHASDARRKTDLTLLQTAFEGYKNDHDGYPDAGAINTCGDTNLAPYIATIPCDPQSRAPYGYFPSAATGGYRLCTVLTDTTDPAIAQAQCNGPDGCGLGGGFNYCLANGTTASAVGSSEQVIATPTNGPTPTPPGENACTPPDSFGASHCNTYVYPLFQSCPKVYGNDKTCNNDECNRDASVRCPF